MLGVYCGFGFFGKYTHKEFREGGTLIKEKITEVDIGNASYAFRKYAVGGIVGLGFEYKKFMLSCSYDYGISQIDNVTINNKEYRNRGFQFTIGTIFESNFLMN